MIRLWSSIPVFRFLSDSWREFFVVPCTVSEFSANLVDCVLFFCFSDTYFFLLKFSIFLAVYIFFFLRFVFLPRSRVTYFVRLSFWFRVLFRAVPVLSVVADFVCFCRVNYTLFFAPRIFYFRILICRVAAWFLRSFSYILRQFLILNVFSDFCLFSTMVIVDDRTAEFLAEVRRALEESRVEAGLPPTTTAAPSLEELAAAVRESGLVGALNHVVATTISSTVSLFFLYFPVLYGILLRCFNGIFFVWRVLLRTMRYRSFYWFSTLSWRFPRYLFIGD
jgi:hypothetical protein